MQPDLIKLSDSSKQENSKILQALLFASENNVKKNKIKELLGWSSEVLEDAILMLSKDLETSALELTETATGFRLQIRATYAPLIQKLWPEKQTKLSQAFLETLSIIAYKQPVTRADVEQIRGVSTSSNILRQMFDKGWIVEKGFRDLPGKPALLHTTNEFLNAFSLTSLKDLPILPELKEISELE